MARVVRQAAMACADALLGGGCWCRCGAAVWGPPAGLGAYVWAAQARCGQGQGLRREAPPFVPGQGVPLAMATPSLAISLVGSVCGEVDAEVLEDKQVSDGEGESQFLHSACVTPGFKEENEDEVLMEVPLEVLLSIRRRRKRRRAAVRAGPEAVKRYELVRTRRAWRLAWCVLGLRRFGLVRTRCARSLASFGRWR